MRNSIIKDINLADEGRRKIEWVKSKGVFTSPKQ
jgi:S-adenosylhomocysteine hydrolase